GTTGKMAVLAGRNFIGCEISSEYMEIARARIEAAIASPSQSELFKAA
ncbi:DNA methyltransferase, partial [Propionivibrio sp.]